MSKIKILQHKEKTELKYDIVEETENAYGIKFYSWSDVTFVPKKQVEDTHYVVEEEM